MAMNRQQIGSRESGECPGGHRQARRPRSNRLEAVVARAEEDLKNATIVSPIDGVVLSRDREMGDAVSSILTMGSGATLIMTLGDLTEVYVKGKVDESDIGKVYMASRRGSPWSPIRTRSSRER